MGICENWPRRAVSETWPRRVRRAVSETWPRKVPAGLFLLLIAVAVIRVASTYQVFSQTVDEPVHLASGFQWLTEGRYDLDIEHPPLARVGFALDAWLDRATVDPALDRSAQGTALLYRDHSYERNLGRSRAANLPFLLLTLVMVYLWTRSVAGEGCALIAVALCGALPPLLGHAGLATTDAAATATVVTSLFLVSRWLGTASWRWGVALGMGIGIGLLSKMSFAPFFAAGGVAIFLTHPIGRAQHRGRQAIAIAALAVMFLWAGYRFELRRFNDLRLQQPAPSPQHVAAKYAQHPGYEWVRPDLIVRYWAYARTAEDRGIKGVDFVDWAKAAGYPSPAAGRHGNTVAAAPPVPDPTIAQRLAEPLRKAAQWMAIRLPLPATTYFSGLNLVRQHSRWGHHSSYLFGEVRTRGWWYYFPVILFFKTPLPLLMLFLIGVKGDRRAWPFALAALLMLLLSMTSSINIGVRHVLPIYPLMVIAAAHGVAWLWRHGRGERLAAAALLAWYFGATAFAHPDYLAYFNEAAGKHPERIAADSNLDWGQDLLRLAGAVRRERLEPLYISYFGSADWRRHLPTARPLPDNQPVAGWIAVSEMHAILELDGSLRWLRRHQPVRRIGKSIRLYDTRRVMPNTIRTMRSSSGGMPSTSVEGAAGS